MQRKMFDILVSAVGLLLVVTLLVAGALLTWGYNFVNSNVHHQLAEQAIVFPSKAELALAHPGTEITPGMLPYLTPYAGQPLTSGAEAEIYADHFIAVHLSEMAYHGIYAKVSAASLADPSNKALAAETQLVFQGTTLRGLLLEAYAFSQMGLIAMYAAIASFVLAALIALLVAFGFWHARRTPEHVELALRPESESEAPNN